ncbi:hypothetical protein TNCT_732041 [Trichonephila clavata]|uniref:Uncharacterized protein n=1 Tax=Trichonephila clavata TaxID=2740835 RepID=A0A8X6HGZ4_TRICU|nr:hypothetical protein TNCT_732041 [Trichonephila clavata]
MPIIFIARSIGYVIGSLIGGLVFDSTPSRRLRNFFIIAFKVGTGLTALGIPFCKTLTTLSVLFFIAGLCLSILDVEDLIVESLKIYGLRYIVDVFPFVERTKHRTRRFNTYLLKIWKGDCQSYFQALHFVYGAGSIIGPVLARTFIKDIESEVVSNSTESVDKIDIEHMPDLMYAYVVLASMTGVVIIFWVLLLCCPASFYKSSKKKPSNVRVSVFHTDF